MAYLSNGMQERFHKVFVDSGSPIKVESNYVLVDQTKDNIQRIVKSIGFCPLISPSKIDEKHAFTVVPYRIPRVFNRDNYFNIEEISRLLGRSRFVSGEESAVVDRWKSVNWFRRVIGSSLNRALFEIISSCVNPEDTIVEIGSGIGYSFPPSLASRIIRTQPHPSECHLLARSIANPIYQITIEDLYNAIQTAPKKKIPLFFSLNVFDCMTPDVREANLRRLSEFQDSGDQILIMLDTNPNLTQIIPEIKALYPGHGIYPGCFTPEKINKTSLILIPMPEPSTTAPEKGKDVSEIVNEEARSIAETGSISKDQEMVQELQRIHNFPVIILEDFFVKQIKNELARIGYECKVYYHAAFTIEKPLKDLATPVGKIFAQINQDLLYKPVTDHASIRQWALSDRNLADNFTQKDIQIPEYFNRLINHLNVKGQKMIGTEVLVIKATKI